FSFPQPENDRWRDLSRKCPLQLEQPGASIWDCLSDKGEEGSRWPRDAAGTCSVTNLIKDLSLSDPHGHPSAPPSKRQCRSLSFSDEMSGCGTSWRPLGSKVWTPVEKRRCYSGGSVQRYSNGFATMQRSSSFSLPARSNPLCGDHPALAGRPGGQPRTSAARGHGGDRVDIQRSLSCSHDRFSCAEQLRFGVGKTPSSSGVTSLPASGFHLVSTSAASLPLPLQNRQTFNSLTCLSTTAEDGSPRLSGPQPWTTAPEVMPGRTPACTPVPEPARARPDDRQASRDDLSCEEEEESTGKEEDREAWRSGGTGTESLFQLDGEIDIEQIENN
ncbi:FA53B protein, partial [Certhia familiaris]|nr:FA53B protein [Certhia familiaris]